MTALIAIFPVAVAPVGCVERKLLIETDPPGAVVYIDEEFRGETPLEIEFLHYGSRLVELRKPGFEPQRFQQPVRAPWYQWFPLDFVSDVLVPFTIHDSRRIERDLTPEAPRRFDEARREEILQRAEELREDTGR